MENRWKPPLAAAAALLALSGVIAFRNGLPFNVAPVWNYLIQISAWIMLAMPLLLVGAVLYADRRISALLGIFLAGAVVHATTGILLNVFGMDRTAARPVWMGLAFFERIASPPILISVVFLCLFHFKGRFERMRVATIAVLAVQQVLMSISWWVFAPWLRAVLSFFAIAAPAMVALVAWCLAFKQVSRNRPPMDAQPVIWLVCPRCQSSQSISAGHGECVNCRLKISISLDEGVCEGCGYRLRGLTENRCPECGKEFADAGHEAGAA